MVMVMVMVSDIGHVPTDVYQPMSTYRRLPTDEPILMNYCPDTVHSYQVHNHYWTLSHNRTLVTLRRRRRPPRALRARATPPREPLSAALSAY
jgi:hypothetical protein